MLRAASTLDGGVRGLAPSLSLYAGDWRKGKGDYSEVRAMLRKLARSKNRATARAATMCRIDLEDALRRDFGKHGAWGAAVILPEAPPKR
jgi:hypothetical protein